MEEAWHAEDCSRAIGDEGVVGDLVTRGGYWRNSRVSYLNFLPTRSMDEEIIEEDGGVGIVSVEVGYGGSAGVIIGDSEGVIGPIRGLPV